MSQIQEERRSLATERAQLSSAHRDLISREKLKTETSVQVRILSVCLTLDMCYNVDKLYSTPHSTPRCLAFPFFPNSAKWELQTQSTVEIQLLSVVVSFTHDWADKE